MDQLFSAYETCKKDRSEFEQMIARISEEMEQKVEGLKAEHKHAIETKDNHIRELYTKVSRH